MSQVVEKSWEIPRKTSELSQKTSEFFPKTWEIIWKMWELFGELSEKKQGWNDGYCGKLKQYGAVRSRSLLLKYAGGATKTLEIQNICVNLCA